MVETLFQDIFRVTGLDPDGKKFDKGNSFFWLNAILFEVEVVIYLIGLYHICVKAFIMFGIVDANGEMYLVFKFDETPDKVRKDNVELFDSLTRFWMFYLLGLGLCKHDVVKRRLFSKCCNVDICLGREDLIADY